MENKTYEIVDSVEKLLSNILINGANKYKIIYTLTNQYRPNIKGNIYFINSFKENTSYPNKTNTKYTPKE